MNFRGGLNFLGLGIALVAIFGFFSFLIPGSFATLQNVETLARQTTIVGLASIGMTYVIVSGGIDLSVGSLVAFVTVVIAWALQHGASPLVAAIAGVIAGMLIGMINGLLVVGLRVGAFIITLGSLLLIRGLAKGLAGEQKIDAAMTWLSNMIGALGPKDRWMILPPGVWLMIGCAILATFVLSRSVFGRYLVAVGANEEASRLAGVPVQRVRIAAFAVGGLMTGLAGLMQFSRLTVGDPTVAQGLELDVIAAVVIGGAALSGGEGTILGSLLGASIMSTIRAGCSQKGLPNWTQEVVTGMIIVAAVALDRWRIGRKQSG